MFKNYNHLGFHNPYFIWHDGRLEIEKRFPDIVRRKGSPLELDIASVIQFLMKSYMLGDRTILKNVYKTPWMAKPNKKMNRWDYHKIKVHQNKKESASFVAEELFIKLQEEIANYIGTSKKIGILLSGGMDSWIVAGTLDYLIKRNHLPNITVKAFTWGNSNSRDVIYSKIIAERLGWEWKHLTVSQESVMHNINVAADYGCEYSPIHLHAIPQIKKERGLDCFLAGSFGDSIGRAEYEGIKVMNLKSPLNRFRNFGNILKFRAYKNHITDSINDIKQYHKLYPQQFKYQLYESDMQIHYMRRKLNPCMAVLDETAPVYQAFTSPVIFEFMWSIDPAYRSDKIYEYLMKLFDTELNDIPWARTGIKYGQNDGEKDNYEKVHHSYDHIINSDLFEFIEDKVLSPAIQRLGIFNKTSLYTLLKLLKITPKGYNIVYGERLCWIASLALMVEKYDISQNEFYSSDARDLINGMILCPAEVLIRTVNEAGRKFLYNN